MGTYTLRRCPVCGTAQRVLVCPFNSLAMLDEFADKDVARSEYALCQCCGLVYATRRPDARLFAALFERFDENLGRRPKTRVPSDQERERLARRMERGWAPSEELGLADDDWLGDLWGDRVASAPYLTVLASSLDLRGKRVLELRSVTGVMLDSLRSWFGADVYALPAFERDRYVIERMWDIPATACIDFRDLDVPYEGEFDLIMAKHMLTHALDPGALLDGMRARLRPHGWIFLSFEHNDRILWESRKNLISQLRCFHFQHFDVPALGRCLRARGFEPVLIRNVERASMAVLARADETAAFVPIPAPELDDRLDMYRRWYDVSVLSVPPQLARAFSDELPAATERAIARDDARVGIDGSVETARRYSISNADGFIARNEAARRAVAEETAAVPA